MEVSSSHQMYVFFIYILSGLICGIFFDLQRTLRKKYTAGNIRTALEDFLFAVFVVFMTIAPGFYFNNGEIRYYQLTGIICGGIIYAAVLSSFLRKILYILIVLTEKIIVFPIKKICMITLKPLRLLKNRIKAMGKALKKVEKRLFVHLNKRRKALKKRMKML